jgi:hypothetical protein
MPRRMRIVIPMFFIIIMACASVPVKEEMEEVIYPGGDYEECVELVPGEVIEYSFEASMPVDFNIHYHFRGKVFYPVKEVGVSSFSGSLDVEELPYYTGSDRYFCMMWENHHRRMRITLRYRYRVVEKEGHWLRHSIHPY